MVTQPIAGSVSDGFGSRFGRRRPFILGSAMLDGVFIVLFGLAFNFWFAFVAYALLQVVSNFGQAAYQALVPDFAPQEERGVASGAKQAMEVGGSVVGLGVAGLFTSINVVWGAYAIAHRAAAGWAGSPSSAGFESRRPSVRPSGAASGRANFKTFLYDARANMGFTRVARRALPLLPRLRVHPAVPAQLSLRRLPPLEPGRLGSGHPDPGDGRRDYGRAAGGQRRRPAGAKAGRASSRRSWRRSILCPSPSSRTCT